MKNPIAVVTTWYHTRKELLKERILYGLRYSGLSIKWGLAALLEKFLDVARRKITLMLMRVHERSIVTANRIWEDRKALGQVDQEETSDQPFSEVYSGPDKAEELVEAEEGLIVGEVPYEREVPSEEVAQYTSQ